MTGTNKKNSAEEIKKMQEEAIRRVKEMHARSKFSDFSQKSQVGGSPTNEKKSQNTEQTYKTQKKGSTQEKPQVQKKNSNFNLRKTNFIINSLTKENQKSLSSTKRSGPGNIPAGFTNLMDLLFKDEDKSLLIVLIILLMDNEENFTILLVLFYLLI